MLTTTEQEKKITVSVIFDFHSVSSLLRSLRKKNREMFVCHDGGDDPSLCGIAHEKEEEEGRRRRRRRQTNTRETVGSSAFSSKDKKTPAQSSTFNFHCWLTKGE